MASMCLCLGCLPCLDPHSPAPSATVQQRPAPALPAPGPALVRTVSPGPKHRYRGSTFNPPYTDMLGRHPTSKISPMPFYFPGHPRQKTPRPGIDSPQKFFKQKSGRSGAFTERFLDLSGAPHPHGPPLSVASWRPERPSAPCPPPSCSWPGGRGIDDPGVPPLSITGPRFCHHLLDNQRVPPAMVAGPYPNRSQYGIWVLGVWYAKIFKKCLLT
jgi:hypothetical protein